MKRILYLSIIIALALTSCKKTHPPVAEFQIDSSNLVVGQELFFMNHSSDGVSYKWDFGDGYISEEFEPYHTYTTNGFYTVKLTVTGEHGQDVATLDIEIKIPTILAIDVIEYYQELPISDVEVRLYGSIDDWDAANENWVVMGMTNNNGQVVFSDLPSKVYYIDAFKGYNTMGYDNYALASEDINFIKTNLVIPNLVNYFTAYVDVVNHASAKGGRSRSLVIKKLERTPSDKIAHQFKNTDWRTLYEMSVKK
jgi:PKD repeat protein